MKRKDYWAIGKGLQAVDGLPTSQYLEQVIQDTIERKYDTEKTQKKLKEYYAGINPHTPDFETKEGDKVTARIAAALETYSFPHYRHNLLLILIIDCHTNNYNPNNFLTDIIRPPTKDSFHKRSNHQLFSEPHSPVYWVMLPKQNHHKPE